MQGHLAVEHVLIEIRLIATEQRVAAEALVRLAHAAQEHLREQAFELSRRFAQRRRILRFRVLLQRRERLRIGEKAHGLSHGRTVRSR